MCCSRSMKIAISSENGETPKLVVGFLFEKDTFRKKIMDIVQDFTEPSTTQQRQTLEIVEDF